MTLIGRGDKPRDRCHSADYHTNLSTDNAVKWCLPNSPKPDSPKLGFRVRVSVSANRVSANLDWTGKMQTSSAENASNDTRIRFGPWMQFTVFSKCLYPVQLIWSFKNGLMRMRGSIYADVTKHRTVRTGAKYRSWVLVKYVWCGAYYWFRLRKGTGYSFMHFWLAFCYSCCLFSLRYSCIWGRCSVSWHPIYADESRAENTKLYIVTFRP